MKDTLNKAADALVASYAKKDLRIHHLDRQPLPTREEIIRVIGVCQELLFPGYFGTQGLSEDGLRLHVISRLAWLQETLTEQIKRAFAHGNKIDEPCGTTDKDAAESAANFLLRLPEIREILATDVYAAYDGDPAASCKDEIIFSYPSIYALMIYRMAHEFYKTGVPLIPRIMTEHAHHRTGIDIHPATQIGTHFFIDHGTGVVIGSTAVIGNNVKLYQGVTLGAFSFDKDSDGKLIRNTKRHPTIEDDVVIYSGATILGGETVIGKGSIIGGNVWLTHSVPPGSRVLSDRPHLRIIPQDKTQSTG